MVIERNEKETILRLPADFDIVMLQKLLNFIKYNEAIQGSKASEQDAQELATESKANWWKEHKNKFIK